MRWPPRTRSPHDHEIELRIVTQFALAADPYLAYERRIRDAGQPAAGDRRPARRDVAGHAAQVRHGVRHRPLAGDPAQAVGRPAEAGHHPPAGSPTEIAEEIAAATVADPANLIAGLHLFLFGGLERSAEWLAEMRGAGAEAMRSDGHRPRVPVAARS